MVIERLAPYMKRGQIIVSELVKKKEHGDILLVAGEIQQLTIITDKEYGNGIAMILDDGIGSVRVLVSAIVYERDKENIKNGAIVIVKGAVAQLARSTRGTQHNVEYRIVASGILSLDSIEKIPEKVVKKRVRKPKGEGSDCT